MKWYPHKQSWFIQHDKRDPKACEAFSQWLLDLSAKSGTVSQQKAHALDMIKDPAMEQ